MVRGVVATAKVERFVSVWDAIADSPAQAANLAARAELMRSIAKVVERARWAQAEGAARAGISQPRMNDLLRGRISNFSLDALVGIAEGLGRRVSIRLIRTPRAGKIRSDANHASSPSGSAEAGHRGPDVESTFFQPATRVFEPLLMLPSVVPRFAGVTRRAL